jgi:hypothetical protein
VILERSAITYRLHQRRRCSRGAGSERIPSALVDTVSCGGHPRPRLKPRPQRGTGNPIWIHLPSAISAISALNRPAHPPALVRYWRASVWPRRSLPGDTYGRRVPAVSARSSTVYQSLEFSSDRNRSTTQSSRKCCSRVSRLTPSSGTRSGRSCSSWENQIHYSSR